MILTIQRARLIALTVIAFASASSVSVSSPVPQQSQCSGCSGISFGIDTDSSQAGMISIVAHPSDGFCDTQTCQKFAPANLNCWNPSCEAVVIGRH